MQVIHRNHRLALVATVLWMALLIAVPPATAGDGPWVDIVTPEDGAVLTNKMVTVNGTAVAEPRWVTLGLSEFENGTMTNTKVRGDNLVFNPVVLFEDQFNGATLDTDKRTILADPDNVSLESGALKLNYVWSWPNPSPNYPLVKSSPAGTVAGADIITEFKLKFTAFGYSASGGGVSDGNNDFSKSHMSVKSMYTWNPPSWYSVYADGEPVLNKTGYDYEYHVYTLEYSASSDTYSVYYDGELLRGFSKDTVPNTFWFGPGEVGMYNHRAPVMVDYVEMWALTGEWISPPVEIGYDAVLDGVTPDYTSSHPRSAAVNTWVHASHDGENWTEWVPLVEGIPETPVNGSWYQVKTHLSIPGVKNAGANVRISSIRIDFHAPMASVEVAPWGGEWTLADGLEYWQAQMELVEDANVIQVRVTDTSGAVNTTSISVTVDTIPPVGTMEIAGDYTFTNDVNVTLLVSATDKYGVEFVEVSNYPGFTISNKVAYSGEVQWRMVGAEGRSNVYVRFIDTHGLVSATLTDHVVFDSFPPRGEITIDNGVKYTPVHQVALEFAYSDNNGVTLVELSNEPTFAEPWVVPEGVTLVNDWELAEGGDGVRTVFIRVTDVAGNTYVESDDIQLYIPKPIGSIVIDEGADLTGKSVVDLAIDIPLAARVRLMRIANDPSFEGSTWEKAEEERRWILGDGDGIRTVYVQFLDFRDIVSVAVNDTIRLDTTPPTLNLTLDGGAIYTIDTKVVGSITYSDTSLPVRMWVSEDDSFYRVQDVDYIRTFTWSVPARESDHWVYLRVEDAAGNVGETSAKIHYATILPIIVLALPDGDYTSATDLVPVSITPTDPYGSVEVQVTFDTAPADGDTWMPLNGIMDVEIPDGTPDGPHHIRARARNAAGLVSGVESIEVVLDTRAPTLAILRPVDGSTFHQRGLVVLLEFEASDSTPIRRVAYMVDEGELQELDEDELTANVTLDGFGEHIIEVRVTDSAGNIATRTSVFTVKDASTSSIGPGVGLLALIVLVVLCAAVIAGYGYRRTMMPGLRSTLIHEGDGWHKEWTHPHLETEEEVECNKVPVHPEQARVSRGEAEPSEVPAEPTGDVPEGAVHLEDVDIGDSGAGDHGDWQEY